MNMKHKRMLKFAACSIALAATTAFAVNDPSNAATTSATTIAQMAQNVTGQMSAITQLMIGVAYLSGIGFGIAAIFKFKAHKDNPTQVPIGTPFALLTVSILLVFLPGIFKPAAKSIFGKTSVGMPGMTTDIGDTAATPATSAG